MLNALQKGDEVVTGGGLIGKITGVQDKIVTLEVSEKVRVRVTKAQIVDKFTK
jgi:preprotein translocase subunit YajC